MHSPYWCSFSVAFNLEGDDFRIWQFLHKQFIVFNEDTKRYIDNELQQLPKGRIIGTLLRGTDYTTLCPLGHPRQPDVKEVLKRVEKEFMDGNCEFVYVATEEKRLFDLVCDYFGSDKVLSNNRIYYDDAYYKMQNAYIGMIHFDRDNDNYLKGLEYLSSLTILSNCEGLIAGNSGGTLHALLMAENYRKIHIFNVGFYGGDK